MPRTSDRILAFLSKWTEEKFAYSCPEIAAQLMLDVDDVRLALVVLERTNKVVSVTDNGITYYASQKAQIERSLVSLVKEGKVEVTEDPDGELRYRAAKGSKP